MPLITPFISAQAAAARIADPAVLPYASVAEMLELQPMWVTGHSWQAATGNTVANGRWHERLASRTRMSGITNNAIAGRTVGDMSMLNLGGSYAWIPRTKALICAACTINDVTLWGTGPAGERLGYQLAWRALLTMLTSNAAVAANTSAFVYSSSSTWASVSVTQDTAQAASKSSTGGSWWRTATVGDWFEFTFSGTAVDVLLIARAAGAGLVTFTEGGTARGALDLTAATAQDVPAVHRITGLAAGTHTIRGTLTSGASLTVDSYRIPLTQPAPGVILGEPPVIPAGGDIPGYVTEVETLKGYLASIVAEFPSFTYVDLTQSKVIEPVTGRVMQIYQDWDAATMLVADGKHLNDWGALWAAGKVFAALDARPIAGGLGTLLTQTYPAVYTAPGGPSVPSGGTAGAVPLAAPPTITVNDYTRRWVGRGIPGVAGSPFTTWAAETGAVALTSVNNPVSRDLGSRRRAALNDAGSSQYLKHDSPIAAPVTTIVVGKIRDYVASASYAFAGSSTTNGRVIAVSSSTNRWYINGGHPARLWGHSRWKPRSSRRRVRRGELSRECERVGRCLGECGRHCSDPFNRLRPDLFRDIHERRHIRRQSSTAERSPPPSSPASRRSSPRLTPDRRPPNADDRCCQRRV